MSKSAFDKYWSRVDKSEIPNDTPNYVHAVIKRLARNAYNAGRREFIKGVEELERLLAEEFKETNHA